MKTILLCLSVAFLGVLSEPELTAEAQHYPKHAYPAYPRPSYPAPPAYPKPTYPTAPTYPKYPASPTYPKPAYPKPTYPAPPAYPKPTYPAPAPPAYPAAYGPKYDYCDPRKAPKCSNNGTETFCLKDTEYPEKEVKYAIEYDPLVLKKYADVADQSADNSVEGLTSLAEDHFDYSDYNGKFNEKGHWSGEEGYICPSDVIYARPARAMNVDGEWRVIVQDIAWPGYTQTQRFETCLFPGAACRTLAPCFGSKCLQKYVYQRMLSFDPCDPQKGIFIDIYKLPSTCSCHIPAGLH
ncbi:neurotrophin 1-like [Daphnia pulex]|uniref:neurotrophin 1-like n=1 Tax=Daphnia pulex TaxID=6669 RepID=UPI001EDDF0CB|nr:neurotrophin 1-like [Daphnia pulex]